ncbi:MAG: LamG-like jellyroll fold domain-containing protein [Pirellulaceae bacterium]|nr:LamG domain-containing protein [Planctomycetales bacterium]
MFSDRANAARRFLTQRYRSFLAMACWVMAATIASTVTGLAWADEPTELAKSLLFHASFDGSTDADFARGDRRLYTRATLDEKNEQIGMHSDAVALSPSTGRYGGALRFNKKSDPVILYHGEDNVPSLDHDSGGTISLWMKLDPDADLAPGYVDPLQITDKAWNDACLFVDFTDKVPRKFRLGVFSDYKFWNPNDRPWDDIPDAERPFVAVDKPPFSRERWTHVAITFENFNRVEQAADTTLYLDAKSQGTLRGPQRFTWDPKQVVIMLGIYYTGQLDDFAIFNRPLSTDEIGTLYELKSGVAQLRK